MQLRLFNIKSCQKNPLKPDFDLKKSKISNRILEIKSSTHHILNGSYFLEKVKESKVYLGIASTIALFSSVYVFFLKIPKSEEKNTLPLHDDNAKDLKDALVTQHFTPPKNDSSSNENLILVALSVIGIACLYLYTKNTPENRQIIKSQKHITEKTHLVVAFIANKLRFILTVISQ